MIDIDEYNSNPLFSFLKSPKHEDLDKAEETREMTLLQSVKIMLLRDEGALRYRDRCVGRGNEWFDEKKNNFRYWSAYQGSAARQHSMILAVSSDNEYYLCNFLKIEETGFHNTKEVMETEDLHKLVDLYNKYDAWLHKSMPGN